MKQSFKARAGELISPIDGAEHTECFMSVVAALTMTLANLEEGQLLTSAQFEIWGAVYTDMRARADGIPDGEANNYVDAACERLKAAGLNPGFPDMAPLYGEVHELLPPEDDISYKRLGMQP